jgi:hypothetical protein
MPRAKASAPRVSVTWSKLGKPRARGTGAQSTNLPLVVWSLRCEPAGLVNEPVPYVDVDDARLLGLTAVEDAAVWPNGKFAQLRPRAARTVQNDEHLAALGCDLHPKTGINGVPVDDIDEGVGSVSMTLLLNLIRGMGSSDYDTLRLGAARATAGRGNSDATDRGVRLARGGYSITSRFASRRIRRVPRWQRLVAGQRRNNRHRAEPKPHCRILDTGT